MLLLLSPSLHLPPRLSPVCPILPSILSSPSPSPSTLTACRVDHLPVGLSTPRVLDLTVALAIPMDLARHGPDEPTLLSNSSDPLSSPPGSSDDVPGGRPSAPSIGRNPNFAVPPPVSRPVSSTNSAPAAFYLHSFDQPAIGGFDNPQSAAPKKPGRKKKVVDPDQVVEKPVKEPKKPGRKPRAPKDPNAPAAQRKQKANVPPPPPSTMADQPPPSRGSKISDLVTMQVSPQHPRISSPANSRPAGIYVPPPPGTPSRPATSGQMFDPIRGSTIEKPPPSPTPFMQNRASASPSIKSLIDPHPPTSQPTRIPTTSAVTKPSPSRNSHPAPTTSAPKSTILEDEKPARKPDSGPPSTNPTPPPKQRNKEPPPPPPPLPKGSGLLSGTPFGISAAGANGANGSGVERGTNIWISFALKGKENVTINFSHEVETKYGLSALNPRLAARRERQRQLALAGAELERQARGGTGSAVDGDDMSLDLSEPEGGSDTDVVMKDAAESKDQQPPTKKRKRKAEDYDRNDDFIDDAELLLEEQALMSKDGFFVYSGPLIEEGEKPAVERYVYLLFQRSITNGLCSADGTTKRGRGRGRGAGSRGGAGASGANSGAAGAGSGTEGAGSGTGGRGRGGRGRGGATVRKPRVTKAERALMEQEKLNREKMAASLATKPAQYSAAMI
jgi:hypothetical protein